MNQQKQSEETIKNGVILMVAGLIVKILSAVYKVPFQNLTGNEGFYIYQQIYPVYALLATFSLNGLPLTISKTFVESYQKDERWLTHWFCLALIIGLGMFALLYFGADALAILMGDPQLSGGISILSIAGLLFPLIALARGVYQGQYQTLPTSISQIIEQVIRVSILIIVAYNFDISNMNLAELGKNAYHAVWISALVSLIYLIIYGARQMKLDIHLSKHLLKVDLSTMWIWIKEAVLMTLVSSLLILMQLTDSFTVYNILLNDYSVDMAMNLKGIYDRAHPITQLGLVVGLGFITAALPKLSFLFKEKRLREWQRLIHQMTSLLLVFSFAAISGLIALMPQINLFLFEDQLGVLGINIYVSSIFSIIFIQWLFIIQTSINQPGIRISHIFLVMVIKFILNYLFIPLLNITGASLATSAALFILLVIVRRNNKQLRIASGKTVIKATALAVIMGVIVNLSVNWLISVLNPSRWELVIPLFLGVFIGASLIYCGGQKMRLLPSAAEVGQLIKKRKGDQ